MCGIAGIYNFERKNTVAEKNLENMVATLYHRGPDECGFLYDGHFAMGMSRLSIIDLQSGSQPIHNEDQSVWVVFNGEIFNYPELTEELKRRGHVFYTHSDTETIVHLYEEYGRDFIRHLNGQFAISLWDRRRQKLMLIRDRVGIRPLFYSQPDQRSIVFGSEIKALLAEGRIRACLNGNGIAQAFTFWANVPPETPFKQVKELPAGHFLIASTKGIEIEPYWRLSFPERQEIENKPRTYWLETLNHLLQDAVRIRLRADVPVAAYLSGGMDSSIISHLVKHEKSRFTTFSLTFADADYDERFYQRQMAWQLQSEHYDVQVSNEDIGRLFIDVIRLAEKPVLRTAPAPLLALSGLVREHNIKVVLTGEGADEIFGGYNIFKEDRVRRFWARDPHSGIRPLLLSRLYPYILKSENAINPFWQAFFKKALQDTDNPFYSHLIRWSNAQQFKILFAEDWRSHFDGVLEKSGLVQQIPGNFAKWNSLNRAQFLEAHLFLNGYLLSSQGDRMMMGHSVEGRFPFLDHRLVEFAAQLPPELKINGLQEKFILKQAYRDQIPRDIIERPKQPYRAPVRQSLINGSADSMLNELLSEETLKRYGYFNTRTTGQMVRKIRQNPGNVSARDDMALAGVLSVQLLHYHFIENFNRQPRQLAKSKNVIHLN